MAKYKLIHVDKDDPNACITCINQGLNNNYYKVIEGTERCPMHGGATIKIHKTRKAAMQYRLEVWGRRLKEFSTDSEVKSLREEISILRLLMEETLKKCTTPNDLLMFSTRIQTIANDIQRLVTACDKLEKSMGQMMDRPTAIKFAGRLIEIVSTEIYDPEILDNISAKIIEEIQ